MLGADFVVRAEFGLFDININMDTRRREIGLETETHHHQATLITLSSPSTHSPIFNPHAQPTSPK